MKRLLLFIAILIPLFSAAQTYSGRVTGEDGQPIKGATVMLMGNGGKSAVAFVRTANDGNFTISCNKDKPVDCLLFSCIGYAKDTVMLSAFRQGQTVRMRQQETIIREISVKSERIREHGDTLNYGVANFRQKQDRSIADVIAKMPGLYVNSDGTIEYQGRKINKFYIEGMDLLEGKYSQASENLSADKVKTVQVMRNHQPVKMLRNVEFSEQAALNIVLKDEAKNAWQGIADLAGGRQSQSDEDLLYDNRLVGMLFARKKQSISIYKNNNTGKDILHEITKNNIFDNNAPTETGLLQNITLEVPMLEEYRTRLNSSHVIATNWLFKLKDENDLRLQVNALTDKSRTAMRNETQYINLGNGETIIEDIDAFVYRREISGELMYKVNAGNFYLRNTLSAYADFNHGEGTTVLNGSNIRQHVEPHKRYVKDEFNMIRRLENNRSLAVDAYLSYNCLPSSLLLSDSTMQNINMKSIYWGASTYFMHKFSGLYVKYIAKTTGKTLLLDISSGNMNGNVSYVETYTRLTPSISYGNRRLKTEVSADIGWLTRRLDGRLYNDFVVQPQVKVLVEPTARWNMAASYSYSWLPQGISAIMSIPVFTGYANVTQGIGHVDNITTHKVGGHVGYRNIVSGFFASLNANYSYDSNNILYSGIVTNLVYHNVATEKRAPAHRLNVNGRIAQSLRFWRMTFGITGLYSYNRYKILLDCVPSECRMANITLVTDISAQPLKWFSVEGKSHYIHYQQHAKTNSGQHFLNSFVHILKTYIMPGNWRVEFVNEIYYSNDSSISSSYFCDISLSYRKKLFETGVQLNNMFGRNSFSQHLVTADYNQYMTSTLRPREIIFRLMFSI